MAFKQPVVLIRIAICNQGADQWVEFALINHLLIKKLRFSGTTLRKTNLVELNQVFSKLIVII